MKTYGRIKMVGEPVSEHLEDLLGSRWYKGVCAKYSQKKVFKFLDGKYVLVSGKIKSIADTLNTIIITLEIWVVENCIFEPKRIIIRVPAGKRELIRKYKVGDSLNCIITFTVKPNVFNFEYEGV